MTKLKISLLVVALALFVGFGFAGSANASALTWSADQTIDLTGLDVDLTIVSGSTATSLVVEAGTIQVVLAEADSFNVTSADRELVVSGQTTSVVTNTCSGTIGDATIVGGSAGETITITPKSTQCGVTAGGGSSGGGGGSKKNDDAATPAVPATTPPADCLPGYNFSPSTGRNCNAATPAVPASPALNAPGQGGTPPGNAYAFGLGLVKQGTKGEVCRAWQTFFNAHGANPLLIVDGWCGKLSMAAARVWQAANGLVADGLLGPMSRAKANTQ